jgi:hypothetical protein
MAWRRRVPGTANRADRSPAGRQCIFGATLLVFLTLNGSSFKAVLRRA